MSEENLSEQNNQTKTVQDNVLAAIKAGQVHMKPRWHFVLHTILFIVGLILVLIAALFIGSFFLFTMHQNGAWFAPAFGGSGVRELFTTLPIIFALVAVIFILVLQVLVRHYSFAYAKPVLYTVVAVSVFVIGGSFLIQQSRFHESMLQEARENHLPFAGIFYKQFDVPATARLTPGLVIEQINSGFIMRDPSRRNVTVIITPKTAFPNGEDFDNGDRVIVLGNRQDDLIMAEGIRELRPNERYLPSKDRD